MKLSVNHCLLLFVMTFAICISFSSCCDAPPSIDYFAFEEFTPRIVGNIDQSERTIEVTVPDTVDVTSLSPTVKVFDPECHSVTPPSQSIMDFSNPVVFKVTNERGESVFYEVSVQRIQKVISDLVQITWSEGSEIPQDLAWAASSSLNDKFYITGGITSEGLFSTVLYVYDPELDKWETSHNSLHERRWGHSSSVVDGKIYVMGGCNAAKGPALSSIEVYDPETDTWRHQGEMTIGRIGHSAVSYDGKIYVFGGEYEEPSLTVLRSVEIYDPATNTWKSLSPMSTPRIFMSACLVGDTIYMLGGGSKYPYEGLRSIEAYIIAEDRWEKKTDLKVGLVDLRACVIDYRIYCSGGYLMWTEPSQSFVQVFDPASNVVSIATAMPTPRGAHLMESSQGQIFVMGGLQQWEPELKCTSKIEIGTPEF